MTPPPTSPKTLAVRCLNETRLLHPPTYVASRYLVNSLASNPSSTWTYSSVTRRYPLQKAARFFKLLKFKKTTLDQQREYREYLIPSPMTCLAEAVVLDALGSVPSFIKPFSVYSYRWPIFKGCPYNFEHYYNDYQRRNRDIASTLREHPNSIALIADIEKFYPSIVHRIVSDRFQTRIDASGLPNEIRTTALNLFHHLKSPFQDGRGIATGPEFSHVAGDLALADVDAALNNTFPGRYFRYVDDIVLVLDRQERGRATTLLTNLLQNEGLTINSDKTDVVSASDWLAQGPEYKRIISQVSFESLIFRLKVFFSLHPNAFAEVEAAFRGEGFNLPLGRIRYASKEVNFINKLRLFKWRKWKVFVNALFDNPKSLVQHAIEVRNAISAELSRLASSSIPEAASLRRWHVQRLRYITNRLLYLLPISGLRPIGQAIGNLSEFVETSALLRALISRDFTELLEMPGNAVAAGASLLTSGSTELRRLRLPRLLSAAAKHSAAILLLYDVAELSDETQVEADGDGRDYLLFCAGIAPSRRERHDFSYLDEIRTLQIGRESSDRRHFLEERFAENEHPIFEALGIGDEYYP